MLSKIYKIRNFHCVNGKQEGICDALTVFIVLRILISVGSMVTRYTVGCGKIIMSMKGYIDVFERQRNVLLRKYGQPFLVSLVFFMSLLTLHKRRGKLVVVLCFYIYKKKHWRPLYTR